MFRVTTLGWWRQEDQEFETGYLGLHETLLQNKTITTKSETIP